MRPAIPFAHCFVASASAAVAPITPPPPRRLPRTRLSVTQLEDRVTPSNLPWTLPGPHGPMVFNSTASSASGSALAYSEQDSTTGFFNSFVQLTDLQGNLIGSPVQINTPSGGDAIIAGVAEAQDGNIVAVYIGQGPAGGPGIYFRQINSDGSLPQTSETFVGTSNYAGYGPFLLMPSVAIDPDDNFAVASAENGIQLFSWDLSSVSQPAQFDPNAAGFGYEPAISIATDGTLVETYAGADNSVPTPSQFAQQFNYSLDGNGGFNITTLGNAVSLGNALSSVPVAEPDGSFVAVIGGPNLYWSAGGTGTIYEQHFAADGTAIDQNPVQVSPDINTAAWVAGAWRGSKRQSIYRLVHRGHFGGGFRRRQGPEFVRPGNPAR